MGSLGKLAQKHEAAVPHLGSALSDHHPAVKVQALHDLSLSQSPLAVPEIVRAVTQLKGELREAAITSLANAALTARRFRNTVVLGDNAILKALKRGEMGVAPSFRRT